MDQPWSHNGPIVGKVNADGKVTLSPDAEVAFAAGEPEPSDTQVRAARLRQHLDGDLGRETPEEVRRVAESAREPEPCECDRPDERDNPHRHTFDVACIYWIAGRPSSAACSAAAEERRRPTHTEAYGDRDERVDRVATLHPEQFSDELTYDVADSMRDPDFAEAWERAMKRDAWDEAAEEVTEWLAIHGLRGVPHDPPLNPYDDDAYQRSGPVAPPAPEPAPESEPEPEPDPESEPDFAEEVAERDQRVLAAAWLLEALLPGEGFTIRGSNARRFVETIARYVLLLGDHQPIWLAVHDVEPDQDQTYLTECTACGWRSPEPAPFLAAHHAYNLHCVGPVAEGAVLKHFVHAKMRDGVDVETDRQILWGDGSPLGDGANGANPVGLLDQPGITRFTYTNDLPWARAYRRRCRARLAPGADHRFFGRCELAPHGVDVDHALERGLVNIRWSAQSVMEPVAYRPREEGSS